MENEDKFIAGRYIQRYEYQSFSPSFINKEYEWRDKGINILLEKARGLLGELKAYSRRIPDIEFFIYMHNIKEATTSSRIEGTKTEINEAVLPEKEISPEKKDDWKEVQNYIKAINFALNDLEKIPLCIRLLKDTHKILLTSVRGEKKQPGEVRISQNWIGGSSPGNASFVPPYFDEVPELLSDLEKFWHNDELNIPLLIKIAISHYQFETIHPFLDGNGRIGRLLIILQLIDSKILDKPTLYLSDFFEKNKGTYYDTLTMVRASNNLDQWIKFFLTGVIETSEKAIETFEKIIKIRQICEDKINHNLGKRVKKGHSLLKLMYSKIYIDVNTIAKELRLSYPSANDLVSSFVELGILKEVTQQKQYRKFMFYEYLKLFI